MSLGNILFRPQLLSRQNIDEDAQALDLLMGLMSRLTEDFARGGNASKIIIAVAQEEVNILLEGVQPKLGTANAKIMGWLEPYLSVVKNLNLSDFEDSAEVLPILEKIIELLAKVLDDLQSNNIALRLNALAEIVENDIGLSYQTFENLYSKCFTRVIDALAYDFLQGTQTEEAVLQFALSRQMITLRRLFRDLIAQVPLPSFNRRALIRELQLNLENSTWNQQLQDLRTHLDTAKAKILDLLSLIQEQQSLGLNTSRSVGPDGQLSWYVSWFKGEPTALNHRFQWTDEPFAQEMGLGTEALTFEPKFLEHWAHWTYVLAEAVKSILYGLQMENGNRASPALNMSWQIIMGITSLFAPLAKGNSWADFYTIKNHSTFQLLVTQLLTHLGSFEQFPGCRSWLWATSQHDRDNLAEGKEWPDTIYNFFLSLWTLINKKEKNHEKIEGFTALGRIGGMHLAALMIGRKEWYYSIGSGNFGISALAIFLGGTVTFSGEIIGWLLAGAISGTISKRYWKFEATTFLGGVKEFLGDENAFGGLFYSYLGFYGFWGSFWEGKTSDGTFGVKIRKQISGGPQHLQIRFLGYPRKHNSPYQLPFPPGQTVFCPQAHLGFGTNNYHNGLIYAVDFLLPEGNLVLAMRDGIVAEYQDNLPEDSEEGKNYIIIRHLTLDPEHDRGENGALVTTFARYELAQPFGVRRAFAAIGIPQERIVNTRVNQGNPILILGKRNGFFETDRLQVQVMANDNEGLFYTLPFVFRDLPEEGVPEKGKYYGSSNLSKTALGFSKLHPGVCSGWVRESGANFVVLQPSAPNDDAVLVGAHIHLCYELEDKQPILEYRKITHYDGDSRKVTIEGNWSNGHPPPPGAYYQVGARPFNSASAFDKNFAFLAARNNAGAPIDFPGGRAMDLISKTGLPFEPLATGQITGAGLVGTNEVHLDVSASSVDHSYNLHHLIIKRNDQIIQYRMIQAFRVEGGVKKVFIDGAWDIALQTGPPADTYAIGVPAWFQPSADHRRVAWSPDTDPERYLPNSFSNGEKPFVYYPFPLLE